MADNTKYIKFSQGPSGNFTNLPKDADTLYFLTDKKRIYLGSNEYARPTDDTYNASSDNPLSSKALSGQLTAYLNSAATSAASLYVPLTGNCTKSGTLTMNGQLTMKGNIIPTATNTRSLGSSSYIWQTAYIGTTHGNLNGTASKATVLANARNFSINSAAGIGAAVSFNGSGNVALTVPQQMTGFQSITSETFNIEAISINVMFS